MEATFNLCKKLIENGKGNIVNANIDLYLANNRLTAKEYEKLIRMMNPTGGQDGYADEQP